jgi:DNA-binding beta-propeller fold protein YncE
VRLTCLISLLALTACPGTHTAQKTVEGSFMENPPAMSAPAPAVLAIIGDLRAPESALYDPREDAYFISNMNGGRLDVDGNGFITRVDAKTLRVQLKWIEGLDAPKGMAVLHDTLYVSDVTAVRRFDRHTGLAQGEIPIPDHSFINDITTDGDAVYVSDTGVTMGPGETFVLTGTDAIWKIRGNAVTRIARGRQLERPNGLDFVDGKLRVVTFGGNRIYEILDGRPKTLGHLPRGQLDGLVHLDGGDVLVSSWQGNEIYRGAPDGPFHPILAGLSAPADIGYDPTHHRLLVPHPNNNQVTVHAIR